MAKYLSFGEAASRLGCDNQKVRQLVIEDKSLRATRITPNGLVLSECGLNGHFPYDLDFNSHLSSDGEITCDTYRLNAIGETEKTQTLFVGYLRVESAELQRFLSEQTLFTHDDDTLDDAALSELAARGADAAELVRHMLGGLGDNADSETAKKQKNGTPTRWTPEELHRLKEYRSTHTEDATAQHFGVSGTMVRRQLAKMKEAKTTKPAPVWDGLGQR